MIVKNDADKKAKLIYPVAKSFQIIYSKGFVAGYNYSQSISKDDLVKDLINAKNKIQCLEKDLKEKTDFFNNPDNVAGYLAGM